MVQVPVSLDDWSLELAREIVQTLDGEPSWLDFKEFLNPSGSKRSDNKNSIRRSAAAMANAGGGFIVFGVGDAQKYPDPEQRILGISLNSEGRKQFNEKLSNIFPSLVGFDVKQLPIKAGNGLLVVHMPASPLRPHMLWPEGFFPKRGNGGSADKMTVEEVREQMLGSEERRRNIVLFRMRLGQFHRLADHLRSYEMQRVHECFDRFNTTFYDNLLLQIWPFLPTDWLLARLMAVSEAASRINNALNLASAPSGGGAQQGLDSHYAQVFTGDVDFIQTRGQECQERLEKLFGPMPFST